ncbi:MAG: glycosyltransferase [Chloroflexota bacterium]
MPGDNTRPLDLSLVLPCYNSARFLEESVAAIHLALDRSPLTYEIIFVDDASRDLTASLIERLVAGRPECRFLRHVHNTGRGRAVTDGMRLARGRVVGFVDVDLATPAHYIPLLTHAVLDGADVVTGLRVYKISFDILHRWVLSRGYNRLVRWVLGQSFRDSETGCKFFRAERLVPILDEIENEGWFWDTEIMVRSALHGYTIEELPTVFIRRPELGSTVRLLSDTLDYAIHLVRFRGTLAKMHAVRSAREANPIALAAPGPASDTD